MLKVLLVEDEDLIRRGLRFQMDWTAAGCVVADEAASGREGLENGVNIGAAHIDSPRLDLKQNPLYESEELAFALYGVGTSTAITVSLERGTIAAAAAWSDYAAGYLAVRQAVGNAQPVAL